MDLDEYRRDSLANWDRLAGNWESERDFLRAATGAIGEQIVDRVDPKPGDTILELAAGTGDVGVVAAARVGDGGRLIQTDFAPGMVDAARRYAAQAGVENVEHRQLDAENMDLEDDSVDGVLCRFGYMLMADASAAMRETRRVLREGGRLSFAVWGPADRNQWAFIPGFALVEAGHLPPPDPEAPGIFALGDRERIRDLVTGAGFDDPEIEEVAVEWDYSDPAVHWEKTTKLAGPLSEALATLPENERERIRGLVATRVQEALGQDPTAMHGQSLVVTTS